MWITLVLKFKTKDVDELMKEYKNMKNTYFFCPLFVSIYWRVQIVLHARYSILKYLKILAPLHAFVMYDVLKSNKMIKIAVFQAVNWLICHGSTVFCQDEKHYSPSSIS